MNPHLEFLWLIITGFLISGLALWARSWRTRTKICWSIIVLLTVLASVVNPVYSQYIFPINGVILAISIFLSAERWWRENEQKINRWLYRWFLLRDHEAWIRQEEYKRKMQDLRRELEKKMAKIDAQVQKQRG